MVTWPDTSIETALRDAWVEIDRDAISDNLTTIRSWLAANQGASAGMSSLTQTPLIMGVVKGDAYGHGALEVARLLLDHDISYLAVATVDEGISLRNGLTSHPPILVLGPIPPSALPKAIASDLELTVTDINSLGPISQVAVRQDRMVRVHLKVDTGMHRLGCHPADAKYLVQQIRGLKNLTLAGVYSHLAKAGEYAAVLKQQEQFEKTLETIRYTEVAASAASISMPTLTKSEKFLVHLASSVATRLFASTHYDMVRIGLYLYGLEPCTASADLRPAMSVRARINQLKEIPSGDSVGYGFTWTASRPTRLANLPIGYADGVERALSNRIAGICLGRLVPQVGTISMDQMLFDVTDVPEAKEGEIITLIGSDGEHELFLADWAQILNTITYELASRMQLRLPRLFSGQRKT